MTRTIVVLDGDQTGQELLEEALRVLDPGVTRFDVEFLHFDLSLENRALVLLASLLLIVGGGYAGFYTALKLEKLLRRGEAEVTIVDPLPYMTYQPFLPEVAAGSIAPRHAIVSHRRHLRNTEILTARVTKIDHATKTATITPAFVDDWEFAYDLIVVTAGAVSRTCPIPGVADFAIGMKCIEEAIAVRDQVMTTFDREAMLPAGPERDRLLTVVVIGGGVAGIEVFGELRSLASDLLRYYRTITFEDTNVHLIEAMDRIITIEDGRITSTNADPAQFAHHH